MYLMLGYPGAGKTTTARVISELTGAVHLWADAERHRRYGTPTYTHEENLELYDQLNDSASQLLEEGRSVVFDTAFNFYKDRQHLGAIAARNGAHTVVVWVTTPREIARERAVEDGTLQDTRILGTMPEDDFERISSHLEEPRPDEQVIRVDGTRISKEYIRGLLAT